jgi:hypothetical protein
MQFRRFTRLTSYGGPIRSSYELCRNLALLGCDFRVLTTDASGLDPPSMSRRTRKFVLRKASESAIAIDIYAILRPQSWCVYLVNIFAGRTLCVPDAIPLPAAQETCRLVAPRRIAVLGRLIPPHPKGNLGFPLVYHQVEMMGE